MAKIEFDYVDEKTKEEEHYTLEFSRRTVAALESNGFVLQDAITKPASLLPQLFVGAFAMHHPRLKEEKINTIYKSLADKSQLFEALIESYQAPLNELFDEPEEEEKKVHWKKS